MMCGVTKNKRSATATIFSDTGSTQSAPGDLCFLASLRARRDGCWPQASAGFTTPVSFHPTFKQFFNSPEGGREGGRDDNDRRLGQGIFLTSP